MSLAVAENLAPRMGLFRARRLLLEDVLPGAVLLPQIRVSPLRFILCAALYASLFTSSGRIDDPLVSIRPFRFSMVRRDETKWACQSFIPSSFHPAPGLIPWFLMIAENLFPQANHFSRVFTLVDVMSGETSGPPSPLVFPPLIRMPKTIGN